MSSSYFFIDLTKNKLVHKNTDFERTQITIRWHIWRALDEGSVVGTRSVNFFTVVGKIDGSPSIIGGLLGDCQRRALSPILVKENKIGRRVGVLGLRTWKIWRTKVADKWARQSSKILIFAFGQNYRVLNFYWANFLYHSILFQITPNLFYKKITSRG